jgi:hypothetical protein
MYIINSKHELIFVVLSFATNIACDLFKATNEILVTNVTCNSNITIDGFVNVKSIEVLNSISQVETKIKELNEFLDETFGDSFIPMGDELVDFELKDEEEKK